MTLMAPIAAGSVAEALVTLLRQLSDVVRRLSDAEYAQKPVGVVESSVGGHVRHCLDHVRSLLDAIQTGDLNYDHRRRGTTIESSPDAAIKQMEALVLELRELDDDNDDDDDELVLEMPLRVTVLMSADAAPIQVSSSVGRELAYVLAHTVHHNALIGAMVKTLGGWVPDRFGYAPSTLRHMEARSCAR